MLARISTSRAFTLLEVLVAMAIFGIVGLGASQMLRTVMTTHDRTRAITDTFADYTRAFMLMERDIAQIVPRGVRDEYGEPLPALMVSGGPYLLEFTRSGWNNPLQLPRSNLQRVAYSLDIDGRLLRHIWLVLDRAEDTTPTTQVLLPDVADFRVNLLTTDGNTTSSWPDFNNFGSGGSGGSGGSAGNAPGSLPLAVEVIVETRQMGELRRLIPLVSDVRYARRSDGDEL